MKIDAILESETVVQYLQKRNLVSQYKKAKKYVLAGYFKQTNLKVREPRNKGIISFRINKQFRALSVYKDKSLLVFKIDNHQNS